MAAQMTYIWQQPDKQYFIQNTFLKTWKIILSDSTKWHKRR